MLMAVPKNRTTLQQLPGEQLMEPVPGTATPKITIVTATRAPAPAIPLDPWGNPIIYVNGTGLSVVTAFAGGVPYAKGRYVSSGTSIYACIQANNGSPPVTDTNYWTPVPSGPAIRSADGRPFFASAGADGDFLAADDNLYSYEN